MAVRRVGVSDVQSSAGLCGHAEAAAGRPGRGGARVPPRGPASRECAGVAGVAQAGSAGGVLPGGRRANGRVLLVGMRHQRVPRRHGVPRREARCGAGPLLRLRGGRRRCAGLGGGARRRAGAVRLHRPRAGVEERCACAGIDVPLAARWVRYDGSGHDAVSFFADRHRLLPVSREFQAAGVELGAGEGVRLAAPARHQRVRPAGDPRARQAHSAHGGGRHAPPVGAAGDGRGAADK